MTIAILGRERSARTCYSAETPFSEWRQMYWSGWKLRKYALCISERECDSIIIMIWRWLICSSVGLGLAFAASVTGEVELTNSRNLAVRKHKDYSGVVLWLEPVDRPVPAMAPKKIEMLQKDKQFI